MTSKEERDALMLEATELKAELRKITTVTHGIINRLLSAGDDLLLSVMDENFAGREVSTRGITYGKRSKGAPRAVRPVEEAEPRTPGAPKRRKCSICGTAGHRATTCTKGRPS